MSRYLQIRKKSEGKKGIEKLIDEWALDVFIENEHTKTWEIKTEQLLIWEVP